MVSRRDVIGTLPAALSGGLTLTADQAHAAPLSGREVDVRTFGAVGNGVTDDTSAIEAAHNAVQGLGPNACLRFSPGSYVYAGQGLRQTGGAMVVIGTPGAVSIKLQSDVTLFTCDGGVKQTYITGLATLGGKGLIKFTNDKENVRGIHRISDCTFNDYTECAISNNSIDQPYLSVARCVFYGDKNAHTVGIAWGGYLDLLAIEHCAFLLNAFHIKIGPRLSGSAFIANNDFIAFETGVRSADVWIVPAESSINSGTGIELSHNKFGNENLGLDTPRILVAGEDYASGTDRATRRPDLEKSDGYLRGLIIADNLFSGVSGLRSPVILSVIDAFGQTSLRDNNLVGGQHTYFVEFSNPTRPKADRADLNWQIRLAPNEIVVPQFSKGISNAPIGFVRDDQVDPIVAKMAFVHPSAGDEASFRLLATVLSAADMKTRHATLRGGTSPQRFLGVTFDELGGEVWRDLEPASLGHMAWIDVNARLPEGSRKEGRMRLTVEHSSGRLAAERILVFQPHWLSVKAPFIFPAGPAESGWRVRLSLQPHVDEPLRELHLASLHVYHGRQAMTSGHLRTLGNGTWDGEHIILGQSHLWIDAEGRLKLSLQAPKSDDDGRVVG